MDGGRKAWTWEAVPRPRTAEGLPVFLRIVAFVLRRLGLKSATPDALRRREYLWRAGATGLWLVCAVWVALYVLSDVSSWWLLLSALFDSHAYNTTPGAVLSGFFSGSYDDLSVAILFHLYLAAWAGAALYQLVRLGPDPAGWVAFRRFSLLLLCIISAIGFPLMTLVGAIFDAVPGGWFFDITRLVLTPLLLPFAGLLTIVLLAGSVVLLVAAFVFLLVGLPLMVFAFVEGHEARQAVIRQQKDGLANQIFRLHLWLRGEPLPDLPDDSKGARLATPREIDGLRQADDPAAMVFGHIGAPFALKTDKHVLIMASTRSGKGVTLIVPHLLRYRGSAFVLDPKGENARATIRQRARLNGKVHVLDPFAITGLPQARFNPLARFTAANMEAESKALAAALFLVAERERDHWTAAGQQLLAALILYVFVSPDIPPGKKDLPTVRRILLGGLREALDAMVRIDDAEGLLRDLALSFINTPEREFGSIVSTAQRQTEILDNPYITACLAAAGPGQEVDFKAWRRGTMTVYLCLSAPRFPVFSRWLRLVLTSALDEMTDTLDPPPLPVCFMLDELATLGHLDAVENAVGLAAGYGIQLVTVFQDVAQMRDLYKGRWASFVGNAGVRALFNLDDFDTAQYWSRFIGGRVVETHSRKEDRYGLSDGQNVAEALRPLMPPDQIMMDFASGRMLILAQGAHPITADRVPYWQDQTLAGLWDDPRQPIKHPPPSSPSPPPASPPPPSPPPSAGPSAGPPPTPPAGNGPAGMPTPEWEPRRDARRNHPAFTPDQEAPVAEATPRRSRKKPPPA